MTKLPDPFLTRPLAHRGLHDAHKGCIENSRAAFQAAIDAGYGIELDVQLSNDGQAMVFHDYELSRLTGEKGPIRMRTAAALKKIGLTGSDETIPSLPEILDLVKGQVPVLIEIKEQDGAMGPDVGILENAVARALVGYSGPCAVMCFNPHAIDAFGQAAPNVARGLVTGPFTSDDWVLIKEPMRESLRNIEAYERVGACFISHRFNDLNRPRVAELKAKGARVICWTVRSTEIEKDARQIADTITFEGYKAEIPLP